MTPDPLAAGPAARIRIALSALLALLGLAGCAGSPPIEREAVITGDGYAGDRRPYQPLLAPFEAVPVVPQARADGLLPRVDRIRVVIDRGAAMTVPDPSQPSGERDLAHTLIQRLRATLTDDPRPLRVIARTASPAGGGPPGPFVGDARRPEAGEPAGAMTLAEQLAAQRAALHRGSDRVALVVLTRWARLDEATVVAARRLHNALGPRLCSYWIGVGERRACPRTLVADHCGFARTGTAIADGPGLFRFSRQAFFGPQRDRDGDGVVDVEDRCAGTEAGTRVDWDGCSWRARRPQRPATEAGTRRRLAVIHFETDSAALDGADQGILDRLCRRARRAPDARYVIRGHTDARHRRDYNQDLGRQRAQAVADYLASCLSRPPALRSFGESRPQASNATPAGRARNRRVEIWQRPGEARR